MILLALTQVLVRIAQRNFEDMLYSPKNRQKMKLDT